MINLFQEFQELRKIFCICPCCHEIVRVSDLHLKVKGPAVKTWLDMYEKKASVVGNKEERFEERKEKIKEEHREKGRKAADKVIKKTILPVFNQMKIASPDVIPLMHPVDFIVFKGMDNKNKVSDVMFLSKKTQFAQLQALRKQVKSAVEKKAYTWQVGRISDEGKIEFE